MRITNSNQILGMLTMAAALCIVDVALAQNAPAPSGMKTIGTPSAAAKPEIVPSLFVLNSRGATLQGDTLTLTGVMPHSIIFADRPVRAAGHQLTADIIADWGAGDDSFTKNPPNATVSVFSGDGAAALFIDIIGRPLTPLSFAGVARRSAFRGAMYAGAVGAAAYGAAAYGAPYYRPYPPPPACGYY